MNCKDKTVALHHKTGRQSLDDAIQQIDASVFIGDEFFDLDNAKMLLVYAERWAREMQSSIAEIETEETA